jgi:hypothetical protein
VDYGAHTLARPVSISPPSAGYPFSPFTYPMAFIAPGDLTVPTLGSRTGVEDE